MATGFQFREISTGQFRGAGGRFVPNPVGIAQLANTTGMMQALQDEAEKIAEAARELARSDAFQTGAYMRSIKGVAGFDKAAKTMVGRVNAFDFKAAWIEFGSSKIQPARHILTRAAEALGYSLSAQSNVRRILGTGLERVVSLAR